MSTPNPTPRPTPRPTPTTPTPTPTPTRGGIPPVLQTALDQLQSQAFNFGMRFINDARVRQNYMAEIKRYSDHLINEVSAGRMTSQAAAEAANTARNTILDASRARLSDLGLALSQAEKATGIPLVDLQEKYAKQLFNRAFNQLDNQQRNQVWLKIVERAGASNPKWNAYARRLGTAGRGLLVLSLAIAVYNVATAEDKVNAAGREGATLGGGFLGGAAGGALAGLACGPGAPVCVGIGIFVGGVAGALGADWAFTSLFGR